MYIYFITTVVFVKPQKWAHSKDAADDDDDHISFSLFSLTSRSRNGVETKRRIGSTQWVTAIGVKAEADWSLWKSLNQGSRKRSWVLLVTKLCLFKQETTKIIVTFISFEIEDVLSCLNFSPCHHTCELDWWPATRKRCGSFVLDSSPQGFPRSLRGATLWCSDVTHDTPRNSPSTIRFYCVEFPITLHVSCGFFCKLIAGLCMFRLHGFHITASLPIPFAKECERRFLQTWCGFLICYLVAVCSRGNQFESWRRMSSWAEWQISSPINNQNRTLS